MAYGAMGRVGFLYQSAKDQLKYYNMSRKKYIHIVMAIGGYMALDDKDFDKNRQESQSSSELAEMLMAAFGDGTKK